MKRLLTKLPADVFVDEIWSLDVIQHGDAGLINADKLGMLCELGCFMVNMLKTLILFE